MVIYADVLMVLNMAVNYFLLLAASRLCKLNLKLGRLLLGAGIGGILSLYILLPPLGSFFEAALRPVFAAGIVFAAFGRRRPRVFLQIWAVFFGVTLLFGGAMLALYTLFRPDGMAIDGGVVYFRISPLLLIISTALCYAIIRLVQFLGQRKSPEAMRQKITLEYLGRSAEFTALIDTGHSLQDPFTGAQVVLISAKGAQKLGNISDAKEIGRYRLIPCRTAGGESILEGLKVDRLLADGRTSGEGLVAAVSKSIGQEDYDAIISPQMLP